MSIPDCISVDIAGEAGISSIGTHFERLKAALSSSQSVVANIAEDAEVDLTLIQLIQSSRRFASEAGKDFALAGPPSGRLLDALRRGGFLSDPADQAFWLSGPGIHE